MSPQIKIDRIEILLPVIIATFYVAVNSDSTSPFLPFRQTHIDSQIFQYMGYSIMNGKVPYTDLFDHKGLLLFFLNGLGLLISKTYGIMLLQVINLSATIYVWYKGLVFVKERLYKYLIIIAILFCLSVYDSVGNCTEEWSLFFLSYPLMVYTNYVHKGQKFIETYKLFSIGICVGAICLLRINNVAPVLGIFIYCAYKAIKEGEYNYLFRSIFLIFVGFALPIGLASLYMYAIDGYRGIDNMFYANVLFNIDYKSVYGGNPSVLARTRFFYKTMLPCLFLLLVIKERKDYVIPLFLGFIIDIPATGNAENYCYLLVCMPLMVFALGCIDNSKFKYVCLLILVCFFAKTFIKNFSIHNFNRQIEGNNVEAIEKSLSSIPRKEWNNVWQYGTAYMLKDLMKLDILQPNRMFLPSQMGESKRLMQEEKHKIQKVKPKFILEAVYHVEDWLNMTRHYQGSESDENFIRENYELVSSNVGEEGTVVNCYKFKD